MSTDSGESNNGKSNNSIHVASLARPYRWVYRWAVGGGQVMVNAGVTSAGQMVCRSDTHPVY